LNGQTVHHGQTVVCAGGPGYNDAAAKALKLETTAAISTQGRTFTTYLFDTATVVTVSTFSPKVAAGIISLTYAAASPARVFANQQIIGFYRDATWNECLGVPIYDFGANNSSFTAASATLDAPVTIYDPAHPFLNGGSLQNVIRSLAAATYLYSPDRLVAMLDTAIAVKGTNRGAGLSVMAAALDFTLSSAPAGPIVDHLAVPPEGRRLFRRVQNDPAQLLRRQYGDQLSYGPVRLRHCNAEVDPGYRGSSLTIVRVH
jgi:hypothetical protein